MTPNLIHTVKCKSKLEPFVGEATKSALLNYLERIIRIRFHFITKKVILYVKYYAVKCNINRRVNLAYLT